MITTYLFDSRTLPDPLTADEMRNGLPKERIEKITRLKDPEDRKQSFAAGLLLKYGLRQEAVSYNSFGRPFSTRTPFNLSHTKNYVILSICRPEKSGGWGQAEKDPVQEGRTAVQIGCDIEKIRPYQQRISGRFFTQAEHEALLAADSRTQDVLFCRYWTRKESVLKLTGIGIGLPMDLFDVRDGRHPVPQEEKIRQWQHSLNEKEKENEKERPEYQNAAWLLLNQQLYFKEYEYDGCCIAVCSTVDAFEDGVRRIWDCAQAASFDMHEG